jgi:hypothetical protein
MKKANIIAPFLVLMLLAFGAAAHAGESPYNLTVHVVNIHRDRWLAQYRAEVRVDGTLYMVVGVTNSKIDMQEGKDYPALRADRHGRANFRIVTPDGNPHWFEISK